MKDIFVWQFWIGILLGYFLLGRLIAFIKSKTMKIA